MRLEAWIGLIVGDLEAQISIPMEAGVESLNAAVALAIVSFEVHRQRTAMMFDITQSAC